MALERFIASKMLRNDDEKKISRPIVRIATIGIAVGVALMFVSVAVVKGFQIEVRDMVVGFGSHFQVVSNDDNISKDSQRLLFEDSVYEKLKSIEHVRHVQVFASKPGILETKEALQGVIIKGVGKDFDWTYINSVMVEGGPWNPDSVLNSNEVVISQYIANRMKLKLHDKVSLYFVNNSSDSRQRNYVVTGIYDTGLEDFDAQYIFVPIEHIQKLAGWGVEAQILADTVCQSGLIALGGLAFGGDGRYSYKWSDPTWRGEGPFFIAPNRDTTITLVVKDGSDTQPDSATILINFLDDSSMESCRPFEVVSDRSGGSSGNYIGGYEVLIDNYEHLLEMDDEIYAELPYYLQTQKITDRNPEIFSWLQMLDINVIIIIVLMVVISIVNMTSALLIIILERQQMIGTLKAVGMQNGPIVRIFLLNAAAVISKGLLWGNLVGIGLCFLQWQFHIVPLDPANYYVNTVPISLEWSDFLILDLGTIAACVLFLVVPAFYVSTISPIKAIRFN
jgi:lipoprotein-releasing system permease protein